MLLTLRRTTAVATLPLVLIAGLIFLTACDSSDVAGIDPEEEVEEAPPLWPLEDGSTWTYDIQLSETGAETLTGTEKLTVVGSEERAGETVTTLRSEMEERDPSFSEIRTVTDGFWFSTMFIKDEAEPGDTYSFRYEGRTLEVEVSATTTTVPAGSFSVKKYTLGAEQEGFSFTADFLFAEGLGLIEYSILEVEPGYEGQILGRLTDSSLL